jgi:hypothetical protein
MHYTYALSDPRNGGVFYVGKGKGRRINIHSWHAKRKNHYNGKLQNKINKVERLGLSVIAEKIFEHEEEWPAQIVEILAIAFYGRGRLCNLTDGGEGATNLDPEVRKKMAAQLSGEKNPMFGKKYSEEEIAQKVAILDAARGLANTPEAIAKRVAKLRGRKLTEAHKARLSALRKGQKIPDVTRAALIAANTGRKPSAATRAKIFQSKLGIPRSPQTIAKMSAFRKGKPGRPHTPESKANIAAALTGVKRSPETRARISASKKGEKHPLFGKRLSDGVRSRMSAAQQGSKNHQFGKLQSPELIARRAAAIKAAWQRKKLQAEVRKEDALA